ncbi:Nesprin1like [Caligus rogercresseyi]|uniref:Nesprin1like n=1 Tax=Caligus rogercresseyi TaxID=217165 RepID=A0A7T8GKC3_CALRO|nr:Nesprin1like [Caligus rogercresseyi]
MLGDSSLERLSLHANLERLKNIQLTLPDEEHRPKLVKSLGEKVIPGTVDLGQVNIRSQIDMTLQEWEGLKSHLQSIIQSLDAKITQWVDFEKMKEACLVWLRDTDTLLHTFDLKCTLSEKTALAAQLKNLQSQIIAKELEMTLSRIKPKNYTSPFTTFEVLT